MKKLKIGFLVPSFPSISETFIVNQIIYLIQQGHSVKIFALKSGDNTVLHQDILKYDLLQKVIFLDDRKTNKLGRFADFFSFLIRGRSSINFKRILKIFKPGDRFIKSINLRYFTKYKWILDQGEFDVFHGHFGVCGEYLAEMKSYGYYSKTKFITSFHGYDLNPSSLNDYKEKYSLLFKETHFCTVNTVYLKDILCKVFDSSRIKVLPVGLDTKKFQKKRVHSSEDIQLLFVGRLITIKGPSFLIVILKELIKQGIPGLRLVIVGEGEEEKTLKDLVESYEIKDKVDFLGALTQEEIIKKMDESHIFVLPGIHDSDGRAETQGLVIQEAQSMCLPVIVSDAGGMKYGVIDGVTGFVVKEGDIAGFVEKIKLLCKDADMRSQMGKEGREFVLENYDSQILGKELENLYLELI